MREREYSRALARRPALVGRSRGTWGEGRGGAASRPSAEFASSSASVARCRATRSVMIMSRFSLSSLGRFVSSPTRSFALMLQTSQDMFVQYGRLKVLLNVDRRDYVSFVSPSRVRSFYSSFVWSRSIKIILYASVIRVWASISIVNETSPERFSVMLYS